MTDSLDQEPSEPPKPTSEEPFVRQEKFSIEGDNDVSIGAIGNNLTELKETLLSNIERMEALLLEEKSIASREAQQYEELRQMQEAKVGLLEARLQEKEESLRMKESANRQLEESLTAKIQELEHRLTEKEGLLDKGGKRS